MSRTLLIDPFSGASGDMLLSSLIDAGASDENIRQQVLSIPELTKIKLEVNEIMKGHFIARQLSIDLPHEHAHRGLSDVSAIINGAPHLSDSVRTKAIATFARLAKCEARVHGTSVEEVHFHEVGALDAILDIVGFYVAVEELGIEQFVYTRIVLGGGKIGSAHGEIPLPAPATLELLNGHAVTFSGRDAELVTPTAAAIIAETFRALGPEESITVGTVGYGAGTREADGLPNILRVTVGELHEAPRTLSVIRCTIDDMNPEAYGHVMTQLFKTGAREVYLNSVMMKKSRPGIELTVLTENKDAHRIGDWILANTSTFGLRVTQEERIEIDRRIDEVGTRLGKARVKVGILGDGNETASPEYEDCRALAEKHSLPLADVFEMVKQAWVTKQS